MSEKTELQKVSEEIMRFMRGKYALDEVGNGKNEVVFRDGDEKVLVIMICDGYYDFHIGQKTIQVSDTESLEKAKQMILAQKEPNRKPFPKENAVYSDCGHRCDLCAYYDGGTIGEELRKELLEHVRRIYCPHVSKEEGQNRPWHCMGCHNKPPDELCRQKKCASEKDVDKCVNCGEYPCDEALGGLKPKIDVELVLLTDDVTWAILPWVERQYGN